MLIAIDKGHTLTGPGSGAVGYLNESRETRRVGDKVVEYLESMGHTVIDVTNDSAPSENADLKLRTDKVTGDCYICLSIHFNAFNGAAHGVEAYTYQGERHKEAGAILDNLEKIGLKNRGVKNGSGFALCNTRATKDILLEVCFVDNWEDSEIYKAHGPEVIAAKIVEGLTGEKIEDKKVASVMTKKYKVMQYGTIIKEIGAIDGDDELSEVKKEVAKWADSVAVDTETNEVVFRFNDIYRVYQGENRIENFESRRSAIEEALKWRHSRITRGDEVIFEHDPILASEFRAYQFDTLLGVYQNLTGAISEGKKYLDSRVETRDGLVVWRFDDSKFRVYNGEHSIYKFDTMAEALVKANKIIGSTIKRDGEIIFIKKR